MRIGILQFAPELGQVDSNIAKANALLRDVNPGALDLLVLPELAFSGYNFPNAAAIKPYLEPTANGPTARWARETALRLMCPVSVGYPEIETETEDTSRAGQPLNANSKTPAPTGIKSTSEPKPNPRRRCYNATLTVHYTGALLAHYRKTNLYYTDATWSWPNPDGFLTVDLSLPIEVRTPTTPEHPTSYLTHLSVPTTFAICMDFNPTHFTAPWTDYELADHILRTDAKLLIASNAWLTHKTREELLSNPKQHDNETLEYWIERLKPLLDEEISLQKKDGGLPLGAGSEGVANGPEKERIIVIANRVGIEEGVCRVCDLTNEEPPMDEQWAGGDWGKGEVKQDVPPDGKKDGGLAGAVAVASAEPTLQAPADDVGRMTGIVALEARYAGSSCVFGLRGDGSIRMYGSLGCAEEKLLVVDTEGGPDWLAKIAGAAYGNLDDDDDDESGKV